MTQLQLSQFICNKLAKTDSTSLALCQSFIANRYQMIWEMYSWNDAQVIVAQSVPSGTLDVTLNAQIDLVTSISWNNISLENFGADTIMRFNPALLQGISGSPVAYVNLTRDSSGNCVIRLINQPQTTQTLLVVGKQKFVPFATTSDSALLRGIDNALLAFGEADMLERERQRGSGQLKIQEATTMLQKMIDIENNQQTNSCRITPEIYDVMNFRTTILDYARPFSN